MPLVPNFSLTAEDKTRFHSKYTKTDGCWNWNTGGVGYGTFKLNGNNEQAHKIALFLKTGQFYAGQDELVGCHRCKQNKKCVNPDHLDWDTSSKNRLDQIRDGTEKPPKGEVNGMAKLTDIEVLAIREKYATETYTQQKLADEYGVSQATISLIILRKLWAHI